MPAKFTKATIFNLTSGIAVNALVGTDYVWANSIHTQVCLCCLFEDRISTYGEVFRTIWNNLREIVLRVSRGLG